MYIPYCTWGLDYGCGFLDFGDTGIEEAGCIFPDDINKELVESYGFSMPDADSAANREALCISFSVEFLCIVLADMAL